MKWLQELAYIGLKEETSPSNVTLQIRNKRNY